MLMSSLRITRFSTILCLLKEIGVQTNYVIAAQLVSQIKKLRVLLSFEDISFILFTTLALTFIDLILA